MSSAAHIAAAPEFNVPKLGASVFYTWDDAVYRGTVTAWTACMTHGAGLSVNATVEHHNVDGDNVVRQVPVGQTFSDAALCCACL